MSKHKRKVTSYSVKWEPFFRCDTWTLADGSSRDIPPEVTVMRNNVYTVTIEEVLQQAGDDFDRMPLAMTWLSIKRNDRAPIHDWRELQRIKNELCGPEREAVEIYPRESRLVDTSNQFHLWVYPAGYTLPFGYAERDVVGEAGAAATGARQRPWPADARPPEADRPVQPLQATTPTIHKRRPK